MAARTWYHIWKSAQPFVPSKHLTARGKVFLGVELQMIYLGTSKGRRSRHRNLYLSIYESPFLFLLIFACTSTRDNRRASAPMLHAHIRGNSILGLLFRTGRGVVVSRRATGQMHFASQHPADSAARPWRFWIFPAPDRLEDRNKLWVIVHIK